MKSNGFSTRVFSVKPKEMSGQQFEFSDGWFSLIRALEQETFNNSEFTKVDAAEVLGSVVLDFAFERELLNSRKSKSEGVV